MADDSRVVLWHGQSNTFNLVGAHHSQYVDFIAEDDDLVNGTVAASVDIVVSSKDPRFNGVLEDRIGITIVDNDFLVTSTADSGPGSLRQAVLDAQDAALSTIRFAPELAGQTIGLRSSLTSSRRIVIDASALTENVIIAPATSTTVTRFFEAKNGLELKNLTLRGFSSTSYGGAILLSQLSLQVDNCVFEGNLAARGGAIAVIKGSGHPSLIIHNTRFGGESSAFANRALEEGGAIYVSEGVGSAGVHDSVFAHNRALTDGGAISSNASSLRLERVVLQDNGAEGNGGAIASRGARTDILASTLARNSSDAGGGIYLAHGQLNLVHSTVSGNTVGSVGGGLRLAGGQAEIYNSTIADNHAEAGGGISIRDNAAAVLTNSIVAGNLAGIGDAQSPSDLAGVSIVSRHSLISDPVSALNVQHGMDGNIVGKSAGDGGRATLTLDEVLFPLTDNGGPAPTHALRPNSPAIDQGQVYPVPGPSHWKITEDQRGTGFPRVVGASIDIGPFESQPNHLPVIASAARYFAVAGQVELFQVMATDFDGPEHSLSFHLTGEDAGAISISANGQLSFKAPPDPTAPGDHDGNNRYQLEIRVMDAWGGVATQSVVVTVLGEHPWQSAVSPVDVDGNGEVTALDALVIINELNMRLQSNPVSGELPAVSSEFGPTYFLDVDGDGKVLPIDALIVINELNRQADAPQTPGGDGESTAGPTALVLSQPKAIARATQESPSTDTQAALIIPQSISQPEVWLMSPVKPRESGPVEEASESPLDKRRPDPDLVDQTFADDVFGREFE